MNEIEKVIEWDTLCLLHETLIEKCPNLRCKKIPKNIYENVRNKSVVKLAPNRNGFALGEDNYAEPLKTLLFAEEIHESIEMRRYDQFSKRIKKIPDPQRRQSYWLEVRLPGLTKGQPSLIPTDKVVLEEYSKYEVCEIVEIEGERVRFKRVPFSEQEFSEPIESHLFNVSFVASGIPFARYHKALKFISRDRYFRDLLFESSPIIHNNQMIFSSQSIAFKKIDMTRTATKVLDQRLLFCNDRQRQAIIGILEARCRPKPYIVFGPPGTGKTFTLVEAIVQIFNRDKKLKILVCANSNNCADQLAQLIHDTNLANSIKRFNSKNHYSKKPVIRHYDTESKLELPRSRVVVTTNNMSANLLGLMKFDYVFIDEAGHAHEPESLIPMISLAPNGCVVLAGDPKQLGPVIKSREVEKLGLGESMLERLFKFKVYERDEHDHEYDRHFITKLILSYRCDPRILALCNKLFYHDELRCLGQCPDSLLKDMDFSHPLVFHPIRGKEAKIETSHSRYNDKEADLCVDYVMKLYDKGISPDKIGVISPYLLQKEKIKDKLAQRLKMKSVLAKLECLSLDVPAATEEQEADLQRLPLQLSKIVNQSDNHTLNSIRQSLIKNFLENKENSNNGSKSNRKKCYWKRGKKIVIENPKAKISKSEARESKKKDWMCQVDTVDAFQGKEKEIIIISTVRTPNRYGSIDQCGFLADSKRFNVAISRAKWLVIIAGHPAVTGCHPNWINFNKFAQRLRPPTPESIPPAKPAALKNVPQAKPANSENTPSKSARKRKRHFKRLRRMLEKARRKVLEAQATTEICQDVSEKSVPIPIISVAC